MALDLHFPYQLCLLIGPGDESVICPEHQETYELCDHEKGNRDAIETDAAAPHRGDFMVAGENREREQ